jgi:hypothetical protein
MLALLTVSGGEDVEILVVLDAGYGVTRLAFLRAELSVELLDWLRGRPEPGLDPAMYPETHRLTPVGIRRGFRNLRPKTALPAGAPRLLRPVRDRAREGWPLAGQFWQRARLTTLALLARWARSPHLPCALLRVRG